MVLSAIIASVVGALVAINTVVEIAMANQNNNGYFAPQYAIAGPGFVGTPYIQQTQLPMYYQQPVQQTIPAPMPVPVVRPVYQAPVQAPVYPSYPWGRTAYISTIANMPMTTTPTYTPNYMYSSAKDNTSSPEQFLISLFRGLGRLLHQVTPMMWDRNPLSLGALLGTSIQNLTTIIRGQHQQYKAPAVIM